ncbi:MAG: hypothetical protein ACPGR8_06400 [Limisphaerales bacterium]
MRRRARKYGAPPSELAKEPKLPVMRPTMPMRKEAINDVLDKMIADNKDPEEAAALKLWKAQIAAREVPGKVDDQFGEDFRCWLLGRGTKTEHDRTRWGRANVAMWNGQVAKYVDGLMNKRLQYALDMVKLSMRQPRSLDEYYLYYKFIVKGKISLEFDESTGLSYYDFSDDTYLDEWERMSKVFDAEPQPVTGYTQEQMGKDVVRCDDSKAPAPKSAAKAEEQQAEELAEKAVKDDAPSIPLDPPVPGMKKEKEEEEPRKPAVKVKKEPKDDKPAKKAKKGDSEPLPAKQVTVEVKELPSKPEKSDVTKAVEEAAQLVAEERERKPKRKADDADSGTKRAKEGPQPMDVEEPPVPIMPIRMPTLPERAPAAEPELPLPEAIRIDADKLWAEVQADMAREAAMPRIEGIPPAPMGILPLHGPARMTTPLLGGMDLTRSKAIVPYEVDEGDYEPMDVDAEFEAPAHEEEEAPEATYEYPAEPATPHPAADVFQSTEGRAGLHNAHTPEHHKGMLKHMEGVVNALRRVTDDAPLAQLVRAADQLKKTRADMLTSELSDKIDQKVYEKLVDDIKIARKETMRALIRMLRKAKEGNNDAMVRHLNDVRKRVQSQTRGLLGGLEKRAREVWRVKTRMRVRPEGDKAQAKALEQAKARRAKLDKLRGNVREAQGGLAFNDWKQEFSALNGVLQASRDAGEDTREVEHGLAVLNHRIQLIPHVDRGSAQWLMSVLINSGAFKHVKFDHDGDAYIVK